MTSTITCNVCKLQYQVEIKINKENAMLIKPLELCDCEVPPYIAAVQNSIAAMENTTVRELPTGPLEVEGVKYTAREVQYIQGISEGLSNRQIADKLTLAEQTVKNVINYIFEKADVCSRTQLTLWAKEKGLA